MMPVKETRYVDQHLVHLSQPKLFFSSLSTNLSLVSFESQPKFSLTSFPQSIDLPLSTNTRLTSLVFRFLATVLQSSFFCLHRFPCAHYSPHLQFFLPLLVSSGFLFSLIFHQLTLSPYLSLE